MNIVTVALGERACCCFPALGSDRSLIRIDLEARIGHDVLDDLVGAGCKIEAKAGGG